MDENYCPGPVFYYLSNGGVRLSWNRFVFVLRRKVSKNDDFSSSQFFTFEFFKRQLARWHGDFWAVIILQVMGYKMVYLSYFTTFRDESFRRSKIFVDQNFSSFFKFSINSRKILNWIKKFDAHRVQCKKYYRVISVLRFFGIGLVWYVLRKVRNAAENHKITKATFWLIQ